MKYINETKEKKNIKTKMKDEKWHSVFAKYMSMRENKLFLSSKNELGNKMKKVTDKTRV